jgi:hypothetical protein
MRNILGKVIEKIKTHVLYSITFFQKSCRSRVNVEKIEQRDRSQMTIWRTHIAFWITKATDTHSECAILTALPLQQWLQERTTMSRYAYISCRVPSSFANAFFYSDFFRRLLYL